MIKNKRGLSPVVATVLLIVVVLVLATAIFIWALTTIKSPVEKFGKDINLACDDVSLSASYSSNSLIIRNTGTVSIRDVRVQTNDDSYDCGIGEGIAPGRTMSISNCPPSGNPNVVNPILLGIEKDGSEVRHTCSNSFSVN